MNRHGGRRQGAGRPRKWRFNDVLRVGQACESAWRDAEQAEFEADRARVFTVDSDIQFLWDEAQRVPVAQRSRWLESEQGQAHLADIETEIDALNETPEGSDQHPRCFRLSTRPPRGTRKLIIAEVAGRLGLSESVVDNLWQAYRRLERRLSDDSVSAET